MSVNGIWITESESCLHGGVYVAHRPLQSTPRGNLKCRHCTIKQCESFAPAGDSCWQRQASQTVAGLQ